jgi:hypothetical protein
MKTIAFLLLLATPMLAHATDIHPGDSLATVEAALGAPTGKAQLGNKLMLDFARGQVQLVDGKVTSSNLISAEKLAAQKAQQKADEAKAAQLKAQRIAEGQALKATKLADPGFTSASSYIQFTFWQNFRLRYPEVPCDDEYKIALARWQADQQQIAEQQQQSSAQTPQYTQDSPATAQPQVAEQPQAQQPCDNQPQQQQYAQPQPCQTDQQPQCIPEQPQATQPQPVATQPPSPPDSSSSSSMSTSPRMTVLSFQNMHF